MSIKCQETTNIEIINAEVTKTTQLWQNMINYIKQYNDITKDYLKKLISFQSKNKQKLYSQFDLKSDKDKILVILSQKIESLIKAQINSITLLIDGLDRSTETNLVTVQEQLKFQSKIRGDYYDGRNDLLENYKLIEKAKKDYFECATIAEDYLVNYQLFKKANLDNDGNIKPSAEAENTSYIEVINQHLHNMNVSEKEYMKLFKKAKNFEKSYIDRTSSSLSTSISITKNIVEGMKNAIVTLMALLRGSSQMLFEESNADLQKFNQEQTGDKYADAISKDCDFRIKLQPVEQEAYCIKSLMKLKNGSDECMSETEFSANNNHIISNMQGVRNIGNLEFEDIHEIVKMMLSNLRIRKQSDYDVNMEGNKIKLNQICNKLLIKEETTITDEEKEKIKDFLKNISCRQFFLQKLNDLRSHGIFKIEFKNYVIIGELLNYILDELAKIDSIQDHYSAKSVIILSQTFYIQSNNGKKKFLQELIESHPLLKEKDFWDRFVNYSISSEIFDSQKTEIKTGIINKSEDDKKFGNIVFAQLVPIADNMIEFGVTVETIKEIIQPIIEYYFISKTNEEMIYGLLDGKKKLLEEERLKKDNEEITQEKKKKEDVKVIVSNSSEGEIKENYIDEKPNIEDNKE